MATSLEISSVVVDDVKMGAHCRECRTVHQSPATDLHQNSVVRVAVCQNPYLLVDGSETCTAGGFNHHTVVVEKGPTRPHRRCICRNPTRHLTQKQKGEKEK